MFKVNSENVVCAVKNPLKPDEVAFGSKDKTLQIWNLKLSKEAPKWQARNLANDELDIKIPIWDTDLAFLSKSNQYSIAACTAYCDVREYDTRGPRKPVTAVKLFANTTDNNDIFQKPELYLSKIF